MEFKINETPFKMDEISAKLFNSQYLSDVTLIVEGKYIYAHSLILMVRSNVFQEQLEKIQNRKKTISISDYGYDTFYQLIQFIYTDQLDNANIDLCILLKLAKEYNVIRLVNHLLNKSCCDLKKLNFCIEQNYKIGVNCIKHNLAAQLKWYLGSDTFLSMHPDTVEEILKFDQIGRHITESDILHELVRWMKHCIPNQIQHHEDRQKFDRLIRLIRFPTMSGEELRTIKIKYPDLLTKYDFMDIASYKIYGAEFDGGVWNCTPRIPCVQPSHEPITDLNKFVFKTKFSVSSDMILGGFVVRGIYSSLRFPAAAMRMNIIISYGHNDTDEAAAININEVDISANYGVINLGTSLHIRPNYIYTIEYKYEYTDDSAKYRRCTPQTDLIINAPSNTVKILEADATMFEIIFYQT